MVGTAFGQPGVLPMPSSVRVGATGVYPNNGGGYLSIDLSVYPTFAPFWGAGTTGFAGVQFIVAGQLHYGWLDLTTNGGGSTTINRMAWETSPQTPIHTSNVIPLPKGASLGLLGLGAVGVNEWRRRRKLAAA